MQELLIIPAIMIFIFVRNRLSTNEEPDEMPIPPVTYFDSDETLCSDYCECEYPNCVHSICWEDFGEQKN